MILKDKYNRVHNYLRISITDRCNLNCLYCNPGKKEKGERRKDKGEVRKGLLSFEEIERIIGIFVKLDFNKVKLTGGEPLARKDFSLLLSKINQIKKVHDFELSVTTNGTLMNGNIKDFKGNGLDRINFSLDSLNSDTFLKISGKDNLNKVMDSIKNSIDAGYNNIKINTVVLNGINDNEIPDFCEFAIDNNVNVRFIEYMPFSNNDWDSRHFISADNIKEIVEEKYELIRIDDTASIAKNYVLKRRKEKGEGSREGVISFISPMSEHFCGQCNRLRITSDGKLQLCLFGTGGDIMDLKELIRNDEVSDEAIMNEINNFIQRKSYEHKPIEELIKLKNNDMLKIGG